MYLVMQGAKNDHELSLKSHYLVFLIFLEMDFKAEFNPVNQDASNISFFLPVYDL